MRTIFLLPTAFLLIFLNSCREEKQPSVPAPPAKPQEAATIPAAPPPPGCRGCHAEIQLDTPHDFACTDCHQGDNNANDRQLAHQGLNAKPAAPESMAAVCGRCHAQQAEGCAQSGHFSLRNEVNLIRRQFGLEPVNSLRELPEPNSLPQSKEDLVNDLLRRRCLRCHPGTAGDSYPHTRRGLGCAACHLRKTEGKLASHAFSLPDEARCLSCHYGNRVGSDFVGMHEHDLGSDFRSPQTTKAPYFRPYGVEQHDLAQDIHRQRGLTCLDCHNGAELSGKQAAVRCADCHDPQPGQIPPLKNLRSEGGQLILTSKASGKEHPVPRLQHPAHAKYGGKVACQVCHAQWSFNDQGTHLLLTYSSDTDPWSSLTVQSSSEAEAFLLGEEDEPVMSDTLSGEKKPGVWLQGYGLRRWENMIIRQDKDGIVKVFRPILDLHLSAVDENGEVLAGFDNIAGNSDGLLPYTPHTTGPAGLFYEQRFLRQLEKDSVSGHSKQSAARP
ncbi:hypothetical protein [Candidatus Electronema sp. JC]|uniref:hypothetical protein n=1 Tax=Candidatus Electronema sp. JC TaxID=3401570 RepID=UPI003B42B300